MGWWLAEAWLKSPAAPAPPTVQYPRAPAPASPAASRRQQWIHIITSAGTPSAQLAAALALSRQVDPADYPNLLKIVRALPGDTLGALLQRAVLSRWLQHDPAAALAYAESQNRELLEETIAAMAGLSPEDQADLAEFALDMPRDQFDLIFSAWENWSPTDSWTALHQLEGTPSLDPELRERLIDGLATSDDFENDPARAIAELSRVAPDLRSDWADWFVEVWARKDPVTARAWAVSVPEDEGRAGLLEAIDESLRPPPSPSSHLEALLVSGIADSPEQRKELWDAAAEFHRLDPTGAEAWADALPDSTLRTAATQAFTGQRPEP